MVTNKKRFRDLFNPTLVKACLVFSQPVVATRLHLQIKRPGVFCLPGCRSINKAPALRLDVDLTTIFF